jgi:hypothetical protein
MLVRMMCSPEEVRDTIEHVESQGLSLINKTKINTNTIELEFTGSGIEAAVYLNRQGAQAFLQFGDGSSSPLHIRKDRDFSD